MILAGWAATASADCLDAQPGEQIDAFETIKGALLAADFDTAAAAIDQGGDRAKNLSAALVSLKAQNVKPFDHCVLLARRDHSPQYRSEIVYFTDGAAQEYWALISGITADGDARIMDVQFGNSYKPFRDWLD
ncbi:MAG: hypothetical protein OIF47_01795 [Marinibacterium sp.]|nr:hypothetical protein [Marinibacterium sp.]